MVKLGIIQTKQFQSNQIAIKKVLEVVKKAGKSETDIVCLPEQWLADNLVSDSDKLFIEIKKRLPKKLYDNNSRCIS